MYSLFKLLSEEPQKIERIIMLFIKLLLTILISGLIFKHNLSMAELVESNTIQKLSLVSILYFFLLITAVWYFIWGVADFIIEILIWLILSIGNNRTIFYSLLEIFGIAKENNRGLSPGKNVIYFANILNSYSVDDEKSLGEIKSRIMDYFVLSCIGFITLLSIQEIHLSLLEKWIGGIIVANTFLGSIVISQINSYLSKNIEELQKKFNRLAFAQKIWNSINQNEFINTNYEIIGDPERVRLKLKSTINSCPLKIQIIPFYYWNELLGKKHLAIGVEELITKSSEPKDDKFYLVVIGNISPQEVKKKMNKQIGFAYIFCDDDKRIDEYFDVFLFEVTKGQYLGAR